MSPHHKQQLDYIKTQPYYEDYLYRLVTSTFNLDEVHDNKYTVINLFDWYPKDIKYNWDRIDDKIFSLFPFDLSSGSTKRTEIKEYLLPSSEYPEYYI